VSKTRGKEGIAIVLSGFPRRSETFALHDVLALEARGLLAAIFATKPGDGQRPHPAYQQLQTPVHLLVGESAAAKASHLVACLNGRPVAGIHAYFAHLPAEVAACAARQLNVPYGFSAHARDVRKVTPQQLARRARQAACVVACNQDVAADLPGDSSAVRLIPHGVDSRRFHPHPFPPVSGNTAAEPFRLLAVGRLVEKKGFAVLIQAVAQLSIPCRLRLIGEGPEQERLATAIRAAHLADRVELCPGQTHAELPQEYAAAHVVVVPSLVDRSGDRDGLPNVVLEAMASGRPVVASDVGAISSAVTPGHTGFLVAPGDASGLARTLAWLADRPALWPELGRNGRARVERDFELRACTERFCGFLESVYTLQG
jgi:glycosyltransferase involved in cell wall biosynthesis